MSSTNGTSSSEKMAAPPLVPSRVRKSVNLAEKRSAVLSQALQTFTSKAELDTTLQGVAELVVPDFCDWCTIDVLHDDWTFRRAAVACDKPRLDDIAGVLRTAFDATAEVPLGMGKAPHPLHFVILSPALLAAETETKVPGFIVDKVEARAAVIKAAQTALVVPIVSREKIIGAFTFVSTSPAKVFSRSDIAFFEDLANAAAIYLDASELRTHVASERSRAELLSLQKNEFLGVVSHELRTPLQAMLGWTQLLIENKLKGPAAVRALESLERNVRAQAQIVEDVLDVSRIGRGLIQLEIAPVDLKLVAEDAVNALRFTAEARRIELLLRAEPGGPIIIDGDRQWLQRVIWNLISNGIKFTPEGGKVSVEMASNKSHAVIRVKDTGKGIPADFLPHVFDGLRQYDGSTTRRYGGLGIGLTIARYITEVHGGTIDADSKGENLGATFTITLPVSSRRQVARPDAAATRSERELNFKPALNGVRVLIVEDDSETRELLCILLQQSGATVTGAGSAKEAMRIIKRGKFDIIVSDIGMEGEDGYELMQQIRAIEAKNGDRTPALALTAFARSDDRIRALAAGFQMHIPKPVEPDELILAVSTLATR
jgi:signal transduction histidine kinase/ActR/RegA family two-component response regulator